MTRWWRSHSVRVRLTLWYVAAMVVVLGVYAAVVFAFVSRNASEALDQRLRGDFQWAAAMVDQTPDGGITWYEQEDLLLEEERPWLQVWSADGAAAASATPRRSGRPLPGSRRARRGAGQDRIVAVDAADAPMRVLSRRGRIGDSGRSSSRSARSEAPMRQRAARARARCFVLGLPLAVGRRRPRRLRAGAPRAGADRAHDASARDRSPPSG